MTSAGRPWARGIREVRPCACGTGIEHFTALLLWLARDYLRKRATGALAGYYVCVLELLNIHRVDWDMAACRSGRKVCVGGGESYCWLMTIKTWSITTATFQMVNDPSSARTSAVLRLWRKLGQPISVVAGYMRLCEIDHLRVDMLSEHVVGWIWAIIHKMRFDTEANDACVPFYRERDKFSLNASPLCKRRVLKQLQATITCQSKLIDVREKAIIY